MPRLRAKAMRSLAGARTVAGRRWNWMSQMASAHVFRELGVGRSSARGMARSAVRMERSSVSMEKIRLTVRVNAFHTMVKQIEE